MYGINHGWVSDNGDGTYRNPILYTDYSDPDVIRTGDDYYMTASSFCNTPGLPILHSKDLVNWKVINYALENLPYESYKKPRHGCGVWAPAIRFYDGIYYIFFPMPDEGIFVTKALDPAGVWSEPEAVFLGKGWIDPCPLWDDDGRVYMVSAFAKSRIGFKSILNLCELDPVTFQIKDEGKHIFNGDETGQITIEGPKLYKRDEYYYIFAPAGGVKTGWQTVLRSKDIWGPYEYRIVLRQGSTDINGPHQGALVDTNSGEEWFIHFQDVFAAGRIVHMQPVAWSEGWPIIGNPINGEACGEPVRFYKKPDTNVKSDIMIPDSSDEFDAPRLLFSWQWNANHESDWYKMNPDKSTICLYAVPRESGCALSDTKNLLLQKWCMPEFTAVTKLYVRSMINGDAAGMVSLGIQYGALAIEKDECGYKLFKIGGDMNFHDEKSYPKENKELAVEFKDGISQIYFMNIVERGEMPSNVSELNQELDEHPYEKVSLLYSLDGEEFHQMLSIDGRAGRWVGVKNGLFCFHEGNETGGSIEVDYFRIEV